MIQGDVFLPTDTVEGSFNTADPTTGAPITLGGTPSLRLERLRSGTWSVITGSGITLSVDANIGGEGAKTGRHQYAIDMDDANIAAAAGDLYAIAINAGTVDGESRVGRIVGYFYVAAEGLTTAQKADVNTEVDTALADRFGAKISDTINDPSATVTGFTTTTSQGSKVLYGICRLTSGALAGEARVVKWTGTTISVLGDADMDAAEKQFSAAPADSVTFDFLPAA